MAWHRQHRIRLTELHIALCAAQGSDQAMNALRTITEPV